MFRKWNILGISITIKSNIVCRSVSRFRMEGVVTIIVNFDINIMKFVQFTMPPHTLTIIYSKPWISLFIWCLFLYYTYKLHTTSICFFFFFLMKIAKLVFLNIINPCINVPRSFVDVTYLKILVKSYLGMTFSTDSRNQK